MTGGLLFVANLACAWFLAGLIWTIQVVHYPLFSRVGREGFAAYEQAHSGMITPLVGPVMLAELAAAASISAGEAMVRSVTRSGE